jgi:hypothetical protein
MQQGVGGKVGGVSVVKDDLNGMCGAFHDRVPFFEGTDDREKFSNIDLIVDL